MGNLILLLFYLIFSKRIFLKTSIAGSIQLKKNDLVCFNFAIPNFKLKINNMIEFNARGNDI